MRKYVITLLAISPWLTGCLQLKNPSEAKTYPQSNWQQENSYSANMLIAETAIKRADYDLAMTHYRLAAFLTNDTTALSYISNRALAANNYDVAAEVVNRWINIQPDSSNAYLAAAVIAIHKHNIKSAALHLERLFELRPEGEKTSNLVKVASITAKSFEADEALDFFYEYVVEPNINEAEAWIQYAQVAEYHSRLDIVEYAMTRNLELDAKNPRVVISLFKTRLLNDDAAGAEKLLIDFIKENKGEIVNPIQNELVRYYYDNNIKYDEALDIAIDLIEKEVYYPKINFTAIVLAQELEKPKTTSGLLKDLIGVEFRNPDLLITIAELAIDVEEYDLATKQLDSIKNPNLFDAVLTTRAKLIGKQNGIDAEIEFLREQINNRAVVNSSLINSLFYVMSENEREDEAVDFITKAIERFPNNAELYYTRGLHLADTGHIEQAISDFEFVIAANPNDAAALNALGYTLADNDMDLGRALTLIERALEFEPDSAYVLDSLGWVHFRLGNYEIAENYLKRANAQTPQGEIKAHLAELYFTIGQKEEAFKLINDALSKFPDNKVVIDTHKRLVD